MSERSGNPHRPRSPYRSGQYAGSVSSISSRTSNQSGYSTRSPPRYRPAQLSFRPSRPPMQEDRETFAARPTQHSLPLGGSVSPIRSRDVSPSYTPTSSTTPVHAVTRYAPPPYSMSPRAPEYTTGTRPALAPEDAMAPRSATTPSYRVQSRRISITIASPQPESYSDRYSSHPSQHNGQSELTVDIRRTRSRSTSRGGVPSDTTSSFSYSYHSESERYSVSTADRQSLRVSHRYGDSGRYSSRE